MEKKQFGINMKQWCAGHEAAVTAAVREGTVTGALLADHERKLVWLQHERLVHLIVTVMVVFVELFVVGLVVLHPELGLLPPILMLGLAVLLGFYFWHYFFLENTVQQWYVLSDQLREQGLAETPKP